MPYIDKERRSDYDKEIKSLVKKVADNEETSQRFMPGDLNYIISQILNIYVQSRGEEYAHYNTAMGVLESAKLELYRTAISAYEEKAKKKNGGL